MQLSHLLSLPLLLLDRQQELSHYSALAEAQYSVERLFLLADERVDIPKTSLQPHVLPARARGRDAEPGVEPRVIWVILVTKHFLDLIGYPVLDVRPADQARAVETDELQLGVLLLEDVLELRVL